MKSSRERHQHDYRFINGCQKKPSNSCQQQFFKTEETSIKGNRNFHILEILHSNYAINVSMIIGSMVAAPKKTLQFISITVSIFKHCHSNLNAIYCNGFRNNVL